MTLLTKYNADTLGWQRKEGPLKVWTVVDGRKKTANGEIPKFSIQEMPEDRYEDALNLMSTVFTQEEPMCACLDLFNDPEAVKDYQKLWSFCLQQGIVVGAFLVEPNNPKPVLAGVNMTWVVCADSGTGMFRDIELTSPKMMIVAKSMSGLEDGMDVKKLYKVDKYMSALGLAVDRPFRGQGLANELLKARDMMSKAYDLHATSTAFTGPASQKAAANIGFEVLIQRNYADIRDEQGNELFPGIPEKTCQLMGKRFS